MNNGQEIKQFRLDSAHKCALYLNKIIFSCEKNMYFFERYNQETSFILCEYYGEVKIPYDKYVALVHKIGTIKMTLLNIIGDAQSSSISYFKFRKQIQKQIKNGKIDIKILDLGNDLEKILSEFNKYRNWQNHVPESLLVAERALMENEGVQLKLNPIGIVHYNYVSYEYFKSFYDENTHFYNQARKIIQSAKEDYSQLIGEPIICSPIYLDKPLSFEQAQSVEMSAKIQGIDF